MGEMFKPYEGPEPYIFVSYAHKDKDVVFPLLDALTTAGYRVWYDETGIPWTVEWADEIAKRVAGCAVCVAFHSARSSVSQHCKAELNRAMSKERPIMSIYLEENVKLPDGLEMYLALYQSVKLSQFKSPAAFVDRFGREKVFASCKSPIWNKVGHIQWRLDSDGVLTIARNENLPNSMKTGSIPTYQDDPVNGGSTAPWMPYRDRILSVVIKDTINGIGEFAFCECQRVTSVYIGENVGKIGDFAFSSCRSMTHLHISNRVTEIGNFAFRDCPNLTSINIPDSVIKIGGFAFTLCNGLTDVYIPDSVTKIRGYAFALCEKLTRVEISSGTNVQTGAFDKHVCVIRRPAYWQQDETKPIS